MNINRIVAATDFSETAMVAVETALSLAMESRATLYLVHVMELPTGVDPMIGVVQPPLPTWREDSMQKLQKLVPENWQQNIRTEKKVLLGSPATSIAEFAQEKNADMIVVGTHGRRGLARMLMGSTAETLLREAPCQVLVVKHKATNEAESEEELSGATA